MSDGLRAVLREPLVHFIAIGVAVFALDAVRSAPAGPEVETRDRAPLSEAGELERALVIDGERERAAKKWRALHGREPSEAEIDEALDRWINEEILYREGLALDLDLDDRLIRSRVVTKMATVLEAQIVVPEPSEQELRAWFEENRDRYATTDRVDFSQVFIDGDDAAAEQRAAEILTLLEGGASPAGLGDRFSGGRRYRGRAISDLSRQFGDTFTAGLAEQAVGTWALRRSRYGLHLVRVDGRSAGSAPEFDVAEATARQDWKDERREAAFADAVADLRARWRVDGAP